MGAIDIAITEARLNIEIDGSHHNTKHDQALADLQRTFYSFQKGYYTLRIPNSLVRNHFTETADYVASFVEFGRNRSRTQGRLQAQLLGRPLLKEKITVI